MNEEQIERVRASFQQVMLHEELVAALFYSRLFELDPALRPLFQVEMRVQGHRFTDMLYTIVDMLPAPDQLLAQVSELGARHRGYGVRPEQYATVGAALFWALRQSLGDSFTAEVEQAWVALYGRLATTMQQS